MKKASAEALPLPPIPYAIDAAALAMVPSASLATPLLRYTCWPPSSYSPSGMPQQRRESEIRQTRPGKSLKAMRTELGWTWSPSQMSSAALAYVVAVLCCPMFEKFTKSLCTK